MIKLRKRKCKNCVFLEELKENHGKKSYKCRIIDCQVNLNCYCDMHSFNTGEAKRKLRELNLSRIIKNEIIRVIGGRHG